MSRPRYVLTAARTAESGGRWWAEIEVNGRVFAAVGATIGFADMPSYLNDLQIPRGLLKGRNVR